MNYTKEQLEKLPRWAQSEIKSLEIYKNSLEQRIKEFAGESETNTFLRDGLEKLPLQNNAIVEFKTGEQNLNSLTVYVRNDGLIDLDTDSRLGHTMVIMPRAANSFYITFIKQ
jgi:Leucine-rich repeat (LRR) protein